MDSLSEGSRTGVANAAPVKVWDPAVRIFHWTVVSGCLLNLFILQSNGTPHKIIGYIVAAALAIRIFWGFIGSGHARFSDFVPKPPAFIRYVSQVMRGEAPRYLGHNPAGAVMMLALMALLAATATTGWMLGLDAFWGASWLEALHGGLGDAILVFALVHAGAALFESWRHRENLVWSMVTGQKRA